VALFLAALSIAAGIEATVRYPVDLRHAAEIDEAVSQELLKALERAPAIKLAGAQDLKLRTEPAA
jgi:hypothetical protein